MRDVLVIGVMALAAGGHYVWSHREAPPPPPLFAGEPPRLDVPAPRIVVPRAAGPDGVLVEKESRGEPDVHLKGQPARPKTLGTTAQLISGGGAAPAAPEPTAEERERAEKAIAAPPAWVQKASTPGGLACVVFIFAVCYLAFSRSLSRGPGGDGFTNT